MTETCQICHTRAPREGGTVCLQCMGLEPEPESGVEPQLGVCDTCGVNFVPYRQGRGIVRNGICYPCMMKKKYPDWIPGGRSNSKEKRKLYHHRYNEKRKLIMTQKDNGNGKSKVSTLEVPNPPTITIPFVGADEEMLRRLTEIAGKERRSIDQQVLHLLDGVMARLVV